MTTVTMGKSIRGNHLGVGYEAKGMFSAMGGFKAGYRFSSKADWTWGDIRFNSLDEALDAGCALAREAISSGRHEARDSVS